MFILNIIYKYFFHKYLYFIRKTNVKATSTHNIYCVCKLKTTYTVNVIKTLSGNKMDP